jgi:multidrug efflux pump subunit AcrA (membrane-fusion protein)
VPETRAPLLRRSWVRRAIPASAVAVLVVAGTIAVRTNASASPSDTYRTTAVTTGSVEQRLNLTGSVQRVNQVSRSFAVPGTVASVAVAVGDTVRAGQTLATLDPKPLAAAVTNAEAALAQARATLESNQTTTTAATPSGSTTATNASLSRTTPTTGVRVASPSGRSGASENQSLAAAQLRVMRAQSAVTADLSRATAILTQCAPFLPSEPPSSAPTTSPTPGPPGGATTTGTLGGAPTAAPPTAAPTPSTPPSPPTDAEMTTCLGALRTAPTQQQIQRDQQALTISQSDLTKAFTLAITTAANTATTSTTSTTPSASRSTGQSSTSASGSTGQSGGGLSGGTSQSSATRIVSDEAAVTNAQASLSSAEADRASATLTSPIAGTVGSVSMVSASSSQGASIVVVGAGAAEVTVNVPLTSMASVHVGQKANVTPQGATSSVPGSVTSISLLPSAASTGTGSAAGTGQGTSAAATSTPAYPVVVLVPDALPALASGSRAQASLLIGAVTGVLTVPNSALTPLGNGQALTLTFKGGVATRALVRTGYAGTLTTQVTSGLSAGQLVVLADLSTPLPTNTTNARRFGVGTGAAGAFTGAGLGGAGLNGGTFNPPPGFNRGG